MQNINALSINVTGKSGKREYTTLQFIQPTYVWLYPVHIPSKHANQPWKKRNKNSRL